MLYDFFLVNSRLAGASSGGDKSEKSTMESTLVRQSRKSSAHPSIMSSHFGLPLPGGAGLGFLRSTALRYPGSGGVVCPNSEKITFPQNLCYHASQQINGLQKRELVGVKFGERGP